MSNTETLSYAQPELDHNQNTNLDAGVHRDIDAFCAASIPSISQNPGETFMLGCLLGDEECCVIRDTWRTSLPVLVLPAGQFDNLTSQNSMVFEDSVLRKVRPEPESDLKARRRRHHIAFQKLAAIPEQMRRERTGCRSSSGASRGWRIRDELLLSFLILAQYPPCFVREAVLGVNLFKARIPQDGPPFKIPAWAEKVLQRKPRAEFWQFHYKSQDGQVFRGLVLQRIAPLLELYITQWRPLLIGEGTDPGTVFFTQSLGAYSSLRLGRHVGNLTVRFAGKRVLPTAIRMSFAYRWLKLNPGKYSVLAAIQWEEYSTIKMRYDEQFRVERRARVHQRKNRYS